jgi:phosphoribosylaminoimidazolecarboxamide formyltransferase/IMP cyclohydrolase
MSELFLECIIAPDFSQGALDVFKSKKNLRVLKSTCVKTKKSASGTSNIQYKSIDGALLAQSVPNDLASASSWTCVSNKKPNESLLTDLWFAMTVCKHVKSNAIVIASDGKTIGVGAGQMSRIDSTRFAIEKAREMGHTLKGAVLASDAFFPFRDCVDMAANAGIQAIVQPGGSVRDQESIDAANEHGIVLMLNGDRYFKH